MYKTQGCFTPPLSHQVPGVTFVSWWDILFFSQFCLISLFVSFLVFKRKMKNVYSPRLVIKPCTFQVCTVWRYPCLILHLDLQIFFFKGITFSFCNLSDEVLWRHHRFLRLSSSLSHFWSCGISLLGPRYL